jgi:Uma2 family endonuclease
VWRGPGNGAVEVNVVVPTSYGEGMTTMTTLLTADEYLTTGDERPRDCELINGDVIVNTPTFRHQRLTARLRFLISVWCDAEAGRGEAPDPIDVKLDDGNVFAPDVQWISAQRMPANDAPNLIGPPDLAIEVRSPSTWKFDVGIKKDTYERAGLPERWLVDLASNTILVFRRSATTSNTFDVALEVTANENLTTPLLPGFVLNVGALFAFADR